jgi:hypothetical protein
MPPGVNVESGGVGLAGDDGVQGARVVVRQNLASFGIVFSQEAC